jgi:hypothetical protein
VGLTPTGKRRLVTAHVASGLGPDFGPQPLHLQQPTIPTEALGPDLNTAFWQVIDIEGRIAKFEKTWHYTCSDVVVFPDFQASSNIQHTRGRFVPK